MSDETVITVKLPGGQSELVKASPKTPLPDFRKAHNVISDAMVFVAGTAATRIRPEREAGFTVGDIVSNGVVTLVAADDDAQEVSVTLSVGDKSVAVRTTRGTTLAALRAAHKADIPDTAAFRLANGAEVRPTDEATTAVAAALGNGDKIVLTVPKSETVTITLLIGSQAGIAVQLSPKEMLATLRSARPQDIPAGATFITAAKAKVLPRDEATTPIAAALTTDGTLRMESAASGVALQIRVNGTAVANPRDVDTSESVADLRARLDKVLPKDARFQRPSGSTREVLAADEKQVPVQELITGTPAGVDLTHTPKPADRPRTDGRSTSTPPKPRTSPTLGSGLDEVVEDRTRVVPGLTGASSKDLVQWRYLAESSRTDLLARFGPDFARTLTIGATGLEPTWHTVIWAETAFADMEPPTRLRRQSLVTFDRDVHEVLKVTTLEAGGEIGVPGLGELKASYSESTEEKDLAFHSKLYLLDKLVVPKVALRVNRAVVRMPATFVADVTRATARDDVEGYLRLLKALNHYGYRVATAWVLGGTLFAEQTVEIDKHTSIKKETRAMSAAFSANLAGAGIPGTVGGSGGHGSGETTSDIRERQSRTESLLSIGGDPAAYTRPLMLASFADDW